ncbi:MAG: Bax inhibitor-1/YccA family protein [Rickettsiales bacterium]|jgi:FtsH-binding integral membrane protein|nr:Bax inhibitor-1/YccA family protein [Rickettsiales bacterium]
MSNYLKKIFGIMFGAVGITALSSYATLRWGISLVFTQTGLSPIFYIAMFGGLGLSIFAQTQAFRIKASTGALLLGIYAVLMGFVITPLVAVAASVNPVSILQAFFIAAAMFGCMALFGYKTVKDLSFLGVFLLAGMIGLLLVGLASMIWPLGGTASMVVSAIGVLIFSLFTAYDMQNLKRAYNEAGRGMENQLAVQGALHLYISFVAIFQYVLSLLNSNR